MRLDLRFNSGVGALLCSCGCILATGWEHDKQTYCCPRFDCCKKWYITAMEYKDKEATYIGFDGKLIG